MLRLKLRAVGARARSRAADRPAAVVVGLDCITGLQTARLLAARGVPVIGVAADRSHFAARTRAARRVVGAPTSGEPLVVALERLGPQLPAPGIAVLVPCTDGAVLTVSAARERLARWYRIVLPEHDTVELLVDKVRFAEYALAQGLPIPPTVILRTVDDAHAAAAQLAFPVVVKPSVKDQRWLASTRAKVFRVRDRRELLDVYAQAAAWSDALVAQTWIDGGEDALYTCNAYFDRTGAPAVTFVTRKIRQWPLDTGIGCLGVEIRDDTILRESVRLFTSLNYRGLAYLEMKRDRRTGAYAITEPNIGRPTGRSACAERAGVELLLTAYSDALGEPLPEARQQRYLGVKWIYWRHDLQASFVRWRRGELGPREWWRSVRGPKVEAVASLRDPLPFIADVAQATRKAVRHMTARARRDLRGP